MKINEIIGYLDYIKRTYRSIILTSNYSKIDDNKISWYNYNAGIYKNFYSKEYELILKNRQYSFLLKDNLGMIQYYYEFCKVDENKIVKIKMAYYPYPIKIREQSDDFENYILEDSEDQYLNEYYFDLWEILNHTFELKISDSELQSILENSQALGNNESIENLLLANLDSKYSHTNSSHLRVDFDEKVTSHNKCEVQIGAINNVRFPLEKIISPVVFFDFIVKNILRGSSDYNNIRDKKGYKSTLHHHRKNLPISIPSFDEDNIYMI